MKQQGVSRYARLAAASLVMICTGIIYMWSVFNAGVREALPRVCAQLDALCERLNACIADMHLPVHAETHDLALNVQEYMMLYDLPRARETVEQLINEGGELVRPCAQALGAALAECDWAGADTCLQQMLALLFDGAADEGEE